MCRTLSIFWRVLVATVAGLLYLGHSISPAQDRSLKGCAETLYKERQVITEGKNPNLPPLFPALDPAYQPLQQTYRDWAACVNGQKAPLSWVKTINGDVYDTASFRGKVVVINFWFIQCAPCRAEMPALNKLVNEYRGKDVLFLGFSTDQADRLNPRFFKENPFHFKIVAESQKLASSFYVMGYPTTYIVDQRGIIRQAWIGFMDSGLDKLGPYHKAKAAIDKLLAAKTK